MPKPLPDRTKYKIFVILTKYLPIVMSQIYMTYYACILGGLNVEWIKYISKLSLLSAVYFYASSIVLHFCMCHRMFIYYLVFCNLTTIYDRHFDTYISVEAWCVFKIFLGAVLMGVLIGYKTKSNDCIACPQDVTDAD